MRAALAYLLRQKIVEIVMWIKFLRTFRDFVDLYEAVVVGDVGAHLKLFHGEHDHFRTRRVRRYFQLHAFPLSADAVTRDLHNRTLDQISLTPSKTWATTKLTITVLTPVMEIRFFVKNRGSGKQGRGGQVTFLKFGAEVRSCIWRFFVLCLNTRTYHLHLGPSPLILH